jgi:hypothetical protein
VLERGHLHDEAGDAVHRLVRQAPVGRVFDLAGHHVLEGEVRAEDGLSAQVDAADAPGAVEIDELVVVALVVVDDQIAREAQVEGMRVLDQGLREHAPHRLVVLPEVLPGHAQTRFLLGASAIARNQHRGLDVGVEAVAQHALVDVLAGQPGALGQRVLERGALARG